MVQAVITSDTAGEAAEKENPPTLAKRTAASKPVTDSEDIVTELPLEEWLLIIATTVKRYEEAGGDISYEQHPDRFVINLHKVMYDEKKRKLELV